MVDRDDEGGRMIKSTGTLLEIVESLEEMNGARITELAERLDLAPSSVHRHLTTLREREYVVKEGERYHLGMKFLKLGEHSRIRRKEYTLVEPKVKQLARETEERAQFIVEEHGKAVYVYTETGANAVNTDSVIGKRTYLHTIAAGKAILASMPRKTVEAIIDRRGLPALTDQTITSRAELFDELDQIETRGYSIIDEEHIEGIKAIGVPVIGKDDAVIGGLSVSGPSHRLTGDLFHNEIPELLMSTANEVGLNIQYS